MPVKRPDRTLGPGHDRFWEGCAREELHLPRCMVCGALAWPIAPTCPACGGDAFVWERLSGQGTILSWCTFERDYYNGQFPMPWDCILVELAEGPLFVSNTGDMSQSDLCVGLPVRVAFLDCEDSAGPFKLPVFQAIEARSPPSKNQELMP